MSDPREPAILQADTNCSVCKKTRPSGDRIPVSRVISRLDACFARNDLDEAVRLLNYWRREAAAMGDESGELSVVNEQLGLYRKVSKKQEAMEAVERAKILVARTEMGQRVSGATILLNAATTCKAFGHAAESLELYDRAGEIYARELPEDDLRHAALENNRATALVDLGEYGEALRLYQSAVARTEQTPESLPDCAATWVNLAHLYDSWKGGETPEIEDCLRRAEEILEDPRLTWDGYYAFVCEKCAPSFDYFGFFFYAQTLNERAKMLYAGT